MWDVWRLISSRGSLTIGMVFERARNKYRGSQIADRACRGMTWSGLFDLICVLVAVSLTGCNQQRPANEVVPYTTLQEWPIPNGGFGKVILIDSLQRNERVLRALGETLFEDTRSGRNAFVFIYDDLRAAAMHRKPPIDDDSAWAFYSEHSVGSYIRNGNTGHHQLEVSTRGPAKSVIRVDY